MNRKVLYLFGLGEGVVKRYGAISLEMLALQLFAEPFALARIYDAFDPNHALDTWVKWFQGSVRRLSVGSAEKPVSIRLHDLTPAYLLSDEDERLQRQKAFELAVTRNLQALDFGQAGVVLTETHVVDLIARHHDSRFVAAPTFPHALRFTAHTAGGKPIMRLRRFQVKSVDS